MVFTSSIRHPNEFSTLSGKTELVEEINSINQSLRLLLTTAKGELFGDPEFGCNLYSYLFDFSGEVFYQLVRSDIIRNVMSQDSRIVITEDDIQFEEDNTTLTIN